MRIISIARPEFMPFDPTYRLPDFTRSGRIFPASTAPKETPATPLARDVRAVSSGVVRLPSTAVAVATFPTVVSLPSSGRGFLDISIPRAQLASMVPPKASGAKLSTIAEPATQGSQWPCSTSVSVKNQVYRPDVQKHPGRSNDNLNGVARINGERLLCRHFVMGLGLDQPGKGTRLTNGKPGFERLNTKQGIEQYLSSQERLDDIKLANRDVSLIANTSFAAFYQDRMAMMAGQPVPWTQRFALLTGPHAMYMELSAKTDAQSKSYSVLRLFDPNSSANWLSRTEIRQDRDIPARISDLFRPYQAATQSRLDFTNNLQAYGFPSELDHGYLLAYALPAGKVSVSGQRFRAYESDSIPKGFLSVAGAALCINKGLQSPIKQAQGLVALGDTVFVDAQISDGLNTAFLDGTVPIQSLLHLIQSLPLSGPGAPDWTRLILARDRHNVPVFHELLDNQIPDRIRAYTQFIDGLPAMLKKRVNWSELQQVVQQALAQAGTGTEPALVAAIQQFTARLQSWSRGQ